MIIETALYQDVLEHSSIFRQLPKDKYPNVLRCLNARVVDYPQDASIAALGDSSGCSGILLTGMLEEYLVDENGNQIIINHLRSGDVFGAESVCAGQVASHVYIHTVEKSKILMLDFAALLSEKTFSCSCRMQVTTNLMQEFARQQNTDSQSEKAAGQVKDLSADVRDRTGRNGLPSLHPQRTLGISLRGPERPLPRTLQNARRGDSEFFGFQAADS